MKTCRTSTFTICCIRNEGRFNHLFFQSIGWILFWGCPAVADSDLGFLSICVGNKVIEWWWEHFLCLLGSGTWDAGVFGLFAPVIWNNDSSRGCPLFLPLVGLSCFLSDGLACSHSFWGFWFSGWTFWSHLFSCKLRFCRLIWHCVFFFEKIYLVNKDIFCCRALISLRCTNEPTAFVTNIRKLSMKLSVFLASTYILYLLQCFLTSWLLKHFTCSCVSCTCTPTDSFDLPVQNQNDELFTKGWNVRLH